MLSLKFLPLATAALLLAACTTPQVQGPRTGTVSPSGDARGQEVVLQALSLLDVRYQYGGNTPEQGFDCSGFVRYVYAQAGGRTLPRSAAEMAKVVERRNRQALRAGDLVFFNTLGRPNSHVGIYLGEARFVHAPSGGGRVRVESMELPYWQQRYEFGGVVR